MSGKRTRPNYGASTYIRGDKQVNALRSGICSPCPKCGKLAGEWCTDKGGKMLMHNHAERVSAGKAAADAFVLSRGRG